MRLERTKIGSTNIWSAGLFVADEPLLATD